MLFVLDQSEQAIIVQFGDPVGDLIVRPGLKFKLPYQEVRPFSATSKP